MRTNLTFTTLFIFKFPIERKINFKITLTIQNKTILWWEYARLCTFNKQKCRMHIDSNERVEVFRSATKSPGDYSGCSKTIESVVIN